MIAPVGAAIGRPPVEIRSDVKQSASAKKIIADITGRDSAKTICVILNADRPSGEERTSDARSWQTANSD